MPIKFWKVNPPPVPTPPATYELTGMSREEAAWLKRAVGARYNALQADHVPSEFGEKEFLNRVNRVLFESPFEREKE
jgi:hypothetical protein